MDNQEIELSITPTFKQQLGWDALLDDSRLFVFFGGGAGGGKILSNNGVVLTPFGWKKGKDLIVGDLINNPDGSIQSLIQIKPEVELPLWRIHFSDGTFTEVAENHLWLSWKGRDSRKINNIETGGEGSAQVVETKKIKEWLERGYTPQIPVCKEQPFNRTVQLPSLAETDRLDPYLLGVLLGDGTITKGNAVITCANSDKLHYFREFGKQDISQGEQTISFIGERRKAICQKLKLYNLEGTKSLTKFIPESYKLSSVENRYAIVQGLMDTDGYKPKDKHSAYYYTISPKLAEDMAFILRSLGAVVTITKDIGKYKKNGERVICNEVYNLYIKHPNPDKLFRMERKKIGRKTQKISKAIVKVETDGFIKGRCITVSNPNGLYITNDFIVTHNSWLGCEWLTVLAYSYPGMKAFIGRKELKRLMGSTYLTLQKVWAHHKIQDDWKLNGQYNYLESRSTGSRIDLLDLDTQPSDPNFDRFGSLEYSVGWIEEAGEVDFLAFDVLKSRIGRHQVKDAEGKDLQPKMFFTFNPSKNWLHSEIYKPSKNGELPPHYVLIQSLYKDNPYTSNTYGFSLGEIKDKATKQRLMFGNWEYDDDPSVLIDYEAILDLFTNSGEKGESYLTCDVARLGKDKTVIMRWQGLQVKEIFYWNKQTLDVTATKIRDLAIKYSIPYSHIIADEDGVGGGLIDHLKGIKGFINNSTALEDPITKKPANFRNLKSQCYHKLAEAINLHKIGITITDERIKNLLIEELEQVKRHNMDKDGKLEVLPKDKVKEILGRSPDYSDALMMRMFFTEKKHILYPSPAGQRQKTNVAL